MVNMYRFFSIQIRNLTIFIVILFLSQLPVPNPLQLNFKVRTVCFSDLLVMVNHYLLSSIRLHFNKYHLRCVWVIHPLTSYMQGHLRKTYAFVVEEDRSDWRKTTYMWQVTGSFLTGGSTPCSTGDSQYYSSVIWERTKLA